MTDRRTFLGGLLATAAVGSTGISLAQQDGSGGTGSEGDDSERDLEEIVSKLTLDEKIQLLHQNDESKIPGIPEHGIPTVYPRDGPNGIRGPDATAFPANIAAASTFDPGLIEKEGKAIAREGKTVGCNHLLAPAVNINRVPVGGRTFEYYSEDPMLAGELAKTFTQGVQSENVVANVKHYVTYNQEENQGSLNVDVSERALREIYYPPYKTAVVEGNAQSVMTATNKINGEYASENEDIINVLKDEWDFEGFVITDIGAIHSAVDSALSGLDSELGGGAYYGEPLKQAVQDGILDEEIVDGMILRLLGALQTVGALDGVGEDEGVVGTDEHFEIAHEMAEEGSVLLKNEDDVLPLDENEIDSLALVGPRPESFRIAGGGSSHVKAVREIGLPEGIDNLVGDEISVDTVSSYRFRMIGPDSVSPSGTDEQGFRAEYFNNPDLSGDPFTTRIVDEVDVNETSEIEGISGQHSIRWTTQLTAPADETVELSLETAAQSTLYIDDEVVLENGGAFFVAPEETTEFELSEGETYEVRLELTGAVRQGLLDSVAYLGWDRPSVDPVREAANVAVDADAAIALVKGDSTEGQDRDDIVLDGTQNELVHKVASANENSIVLLNTGGPVSMPWIDFVSSAMEVWYPGQEAGNAVANLLFGRTNPSGKLPMTLGEERFDYPPDEPTEYPGKNDTVHYNEGIYVGYRYFDEEGIKPIFPFGHGESYTSFEYSDLQVSPGTLRADADSITVSVTVENTGEVDGTEIVQVYLHDGEASIDRPPKELKAFQRVELSAGEQTEVELELDESAFQFYEPLEGWTIEAGTQQVLVGASSRDIRLVTDVEVAGGSENGEDEDDEDEGGNGPPPWAGGDEDD